MFTLILVDYNSVTATMEYITRCRQAMGNKGVAHIVIVENGDGDAAYQTLSAQYGAGTSYTISGVDAPLFLFRNNYQQICYCPSGVNLGYARGNNLGALIARELWADPYYIVSNNDLIFEDTFDLTVVQRFFENNPHIGAVGPQVCTPENEQQSPRRWLGAFHRLIVFYWIFFLGGILPKRIHEKLVAKFCNDVCVDSPTGPCSWISGCFMLLRAQHFHDAGMFDPNTFLYAEEQILSKRLEKIGSEVWFYAELRVIHNHAQTTKNSISAFRMRELDFQSNLHYFKTYCGTGSLLCAAAKINFALYKAIFYVGKKIKQLLHR